MDDCVGLAGKSREHKRIKMCMTFKAVGKA